MIKKINQKIEKLFESTSDIFALQELKKNFFLEDNIQLISNISYAYQKPVNQDEFLHLFSQLSCFFEVGLCFKKQNYNFNSNKYKAIQMFAYGNQFMNLDNLPEIVFPQTTLFNILSTNSQSFLKKMNLQNLDQNNSLQAYLISISPNFSVLLFTEYAEPWAKLRFEKLQSTLMKINFEL
jgi:hypothetical protein